jgi:small subunit ribosomal protein S16
MVKLRLKRFGKKRNPSYRIVAMHATSKRDGEALAELGIYNPRTKETRLDVPAIQKQLQCGAQPTDRVRRILEKAQILPPVDRTTLPPKPPKSASKSA